MSCSKRLFLFFLIYALSCVRLEAEGVIFCPLSSKSSIDAISVVGSNLWAVTGNNELFQIDRDDVVEKIDLGDLRGNPHIESVLQDRRGSFVWLGTTAGLFRVGTSSYLVSEVSIEGQHSKQIYSLQNLHGTYYVSTGLNIYRIDDPLTSNLAIPMEAKGLPYGTLITGLSMSPKGLWLMTEIEGLLGPIYLLPHGKDTLEESFEGIPYAIVEFKDDLLWLTDPNKGSVLAYQNNVWEEPAFEVNLEENRVHSLLHFDGSLFLGTEKGILQSETQELVKSHGQGSNVQVASALSELHVTSIIENNGTLWIEDENRVCRVEQDARLTARIKEEPILSRRTTVIINDIKYQRTTTGREISYASDTDFSVNIKEHFSQDQGSSAEDKFDTIKDNKEYQKTVDYLYYSVTIKDSFGNVYSSGKMKSEQLIPIYLFVAAALSCGFFFVLLCPNYIESLWNDSTDQ